MNIIPNISLLVYRTGVKLLTYFSKTDRYVCNIYNQTKWNFGAEWLGYHFILKKVEEDLTFWPFFGIDYGSNDIKIYIELEPHMISGSYDNVLKNISDGNNFKVDKDKHSIVLRYPSSKFDALNKEPSVEEQIKMLRERFFLSFHLSGSGGPPLQGQPSPDLTGAQPHPYQLTKY